MGDTQLVRYVEAVVTPGRLTVSEVFGPTVQGEGPHAGRRCGFLRLGLCNLDCAWCDTPYTWDWSGQNGTPHVRTDELTAMTFDEAQDAVDALDVDRLVITGGEPLVQRERLARFLDHLNYAGDYAIEVETNGTLMPGPLQGLVDQWNVSPKLSHSGVERGRAWVPDVLEAISDANRGDGLTTPGCAFKFVCRTPHDLNEVDELVGIAELDPATVWIMPEGTDAASITSGMARLADAVVAHGYNLTARLHVLAWGNTRGT